MANKILLGNWKLNLLPDQAAKLVTEICSAASDLPSDLLLGIAAPALLVDRCVQSSRGSKLQIGGQNVYWENSGAFTGEASAEQLKALGASFVITGHSERRNLFNESATDCAKRANFALQNGLKVVFCVGETQAEHDNGETVSAIQRQLDPLIALLKEGAKVTQLSELVIAYEPVWAIGTGRTPTAEIIAASHRSVRSHLAKSFANQSVAVIYGGSVNAENAASLLTAGQVDGFLPGKASLDPAQFIGIAKVLSSALP